MAAAHYGHKREIDTSFPDGSNAQKQSVAIFEHRKGVGPTIMINHWMLHGDIMSWIILANMSREIHD